ncbi:MAG: hypothetical protein KBD66_04370 [Candidatus Doudnabacteria bacterium]|nr:hypothetical protein [Candidatus Doudnabacteria bacterium]
MDERAKINPADQIAFFKNIQHVSGQSWHELAEPFSLSERTLREWARGTYTPSYPVVRTLSQTFAVPLPLSLQIVPAYWHIPLHAKKAGLARVRLHGAPGDRESRRRGGIASQKQKQENPAAYPNSKWVLRKIAHPLTLSTQLAELCGILLGDGGITKNQIKVTLHHTDDAAYAKIVKTMMCDIFQVAPTEYVRKNVRIVCISGVAVVEELIKIGMHPGNKVRMQVNIPEWIRETPAYLRACIRGLIDTDGSVYSHTHTVNGHTYTHQGLTFTSHCAGILHNVHTGLLSEGLHSKLQLPYKLYVYNKADIARYMTVIGTSNPKHRTKWLNYLKRKPG